MCARVLAHEAAKRKPEKRENRHILCMNKGE
jgi:hypothetical protein